LLQETISKFVRPRVRFNSRIHGLKCTDARRCRTVLGLVDRGGGSCEMSWDGIFRWEGCGIVECCCVGLSGSLAYSRILYEQMSSNISTLTQSPVRKFSRRFAPGGLSIRGYFCVFWPFAYLRIAGFPNPVNEDYCTSIRGGLLLKCPHCSSENRT
jgi:hypothetical protein